MRTRKPRQPPYLASRVTYHRERCGMSKAALARAVARAPATISAIEAGRLHISWDSGMAHALALAFGLAGPEDLTRDGPSTPVAPAPDRPA